MIYLDNAATTLIKPDGVIKEMTDVMRYYSANPGRSGHKLSLKAADVVYAARENIAALFGITDSSRLIFTCNATEALNLAINGIVRKHENPHVVISGMEHNSVLRPVHAAAEYTVVWPDEYGRVAAKGVAAAIRRDTCLIITTHASNVVGTTNDIRAIGRLAREKGIPFLVDAAQTAGVIPIDVEEDGIDLLAFAGHKGMLGPTGTGGLYIRDGLDPLPLKTGGTGSVSESYDQPDFMPDKYESGTLNVVGIAGLNAAVNYISSNSKKGMYEVEIELIQRMLEGLSVISGVNIYGTRDLKKRTGVAGFLIRGMDSVETSTLLDDEYDIATRGGMHCAPLAHKSIGTHDTGLVRASVSAFTTVREVNMFLSAVSKIARTLR